jgi:hypothetical protein
MPPADNTPDFDSMSPEELMAWMESLAKRQGAYEGFTTSADIEVPEVDPTTVQDTGPGYIPYGMTQEQWEKKQQEEAARKAARQTAPPPAAVQPPAPIPQPAPVSAPAASSAAAEPDFDAMSPEELMAWMESLAKRQGAYEGFTTSADVEVPEVDPATVRDTGPGYIPYGMTQEQWEKKQQEEAARKAARQTASPPAVSRPATPQPISPPPTAAEPEPAFELPSFDAPPVSAASDTLSWLESLSVDPAAALPDLSSLGADLASFGADLPAFDLPMLDLDALATPLAPPDTSNPLDWLENLSSSGSDPFDLADLAAAEAQETEFTPGSLFGTPSTPVSEAVSDNVDPMEWLESLARRQGVNEEEFMTSASLNVPASPGQTDAPGYTDYVFENDMVGDLLPNLNLDVDDLDADTTAGDPASWLDQLAVSRGEVLQEPPFSEPEVDPLVEQAVNNRVMQSLENPNEFNRDEMRDWLDNLLEQGLKRDDDIGVAEEVPEPELEAQIPDWLIEQVGPPPQIVVDAPKGKTGELPPLIDQIIEPQPVEDIPDWLKENFETDDEALESIFAQVDEERSPATLIPAVDWGPVPTTPIAIDTDDPWIEAFEMERQMGSDGAAVEPVLSFAPVSQPEAALRPAAFAPETELPAGQPESLPDWLAAAAPLPHLEADVTSTEESLAMPDWLRDEPAHTEVLAVVSEDLPEWLRDAGVAKVDTVPDWLIDTIEEPQLPELVTPAAIVPTPRSPAVGISPAPAPVIHPAEVVGVLQNARDQLARGDWQTALHEYEQVVRSNAQLDAVVGDLTSLIKRDDYKNNPSIYRVLGDGLMRQGRLQEALDTYRRALNLL